MIKNVTGCECDVRIEFEGSAKTKGFIAGGYIERIVCRAVDRVEMGEWFVSASAEQLIHLSKLLEGLRGWISGRNEGGEGGI